MGNMILVLYAIRHKSTQQLMRIDCTNSTEHHRDYLVFYLDDDPDCPIWVHHDEGHVRSVMNGGGTGESAGSPTDGGGSEMYEVVRISSTVTVVDGEQPDAVIDIPPEVPALRQLHTLEIHSGEDGNEA
jgi:hypothetical protein